MRLLPRARPRTAPHRRPGPASLSFLPAHAVLARAGLEGDGLGSARPGSAGARRAPKALGDTGDPPAAAAEACPAPGRGDFGPAAAPGGGLKSTKTAVNQKPAANPSQTNTAFSNNSPAPRKTSLNRYKIRLTLKMPFFLPAGGIKPKKSKSAVADGNIFFESCDDFPSPSLSLPFPWDEEAAAEGRGIAPSGRGAAGGGNGGPGPGRNALRDPGRARPAASCEHFPLKRRGKTHPRSPEPQQLWFA